MKIISFDGNVNNKIRRNSNQGNLFDLFQKNIRYTPIPLGYYIVPAEMEMRLDKISNLLYGSPDYVEELMVCNDIISPYSVKEGQLIYFPSSSNLGALYTKDDMLDETEKQRQRLINSTQQNRNKKKINGDQNLPPNIKPSNLEQIKVSEDNKVSLINSFK